MNHPKKHAHVLGLVKPGPTMNALWWTEAQPYPLEPSHGPTAPRSVA